MSWAWRAPATISPGALSPPIASTATGRPEASPPGGSTSRSRLPAGPCTTHNEDTRRAAPWPGGTAGRRCGSAGGAPSSMLVCCGSSPSRSSSWVRPYRGSWARRRRHVTRPGRRPSKRRERRTAESVAGLQSQGSTFRSAPHVEQSPRQFWLQSGAGGSSSSTASWASTSRSTESFTSGYASSPSPDSVKSSRTGTTSLPVATARHRLHSPVQGASTVP